MRAPSSSSFVSEEERILIEDTQSRAAASWGADALLKLKNSNYLVSGLGGAGIEIVKNIVLTRINSVVLHDTKATSWSDLSAQFFLNEEDLGANRAVACRDRVAELNPKVNITAETSPLLEVLSDARFVREDGASSFDCVIITDCVYDDVLEVTDYCHANGIKVIVASSFGPFASVFCDFGTKWTCFDTDGEEFKEVPISIIEPSGDVTIQTGDGIEFHGLHDGDTVRFREVHGLEGLSGQERQVVVKTSCSFNVGDLSAEFGNDFNVTGGFVQGVKKPVDMEFKPFVQSLVQPGQIVLFDMMRFFAPASLHFGFQALSSFAKKNGNLPELGNTEHAAEVVAEAKRLFESGNYEFEFPLDEVDEKLVSKLALYSRGNLSPIASILGGIVAQEAQKSVTGKYTPIRQWFYLDFPECLPDEPLPSEELAPMGCRYDGQIAVFGRSVQEKLAKVNAFMVGSGALGCEYVKLFAMIGLCASSEGHLLVTDMDQIEPSNLNRQFLFRAEHVHKPKSLVAVDAGKRMNPNLNAEPIQEMVAPSTEMIFTPNFWDSKDIIINALDNMKARLYVDHKCVLHHKPLIEAGTDAAKCNSAIVNPDHTVNYGFMPEIDPPTPKSCTLKNFPFLIDHCIQWGREILFEGLFTQDVEAAERYVKEPGFLDSLPSMERAETVKSIDRLVGQGKCTTFKECVAWSRQMFEDLYVSEPKNWKYSYPQDLRTKSGSLFWSGTKRYPQEVLFDPNDAVHMLFIACASALRAKTCGIEIPVARLDKPEGYEVLRSLLSEISVREWVPQKLKAEGDSADDSANQDSEGSSSSEPAIETDVEKILSLLPSPSDVTVSLHPEEFEKDDETNYHIDFIMAASNLRGRVYSLDGADRLKTKLLAGKVIAAVVTTTAAITGFTTMEIIKIVSGLPNSSLRQVTCNLGVSYYSMEEPLEAPTWKYGPEGAQKEFTLWTVHRYDWREKTINEFIDLLKDVHGLDCYALGGCDKTIFNMYMPGPAANGKKTFSEVFKEKNWTLPTAGVLELAVNATDGTTYFDEEMQMETDREPEHLPHFLVQIA